MKAEIAELTKRLEAHEKAKEAEKKKQSKEPISAVNAELMSMIICAKTGDILSDEELKEAQDRLEDLSHYKTMTAEQLGGKSEIVFAQDHVCNANLKFVDDALDGVKMTNAKTGKTILAKRQLDVIKFHTECLVSLEDVNKSNPETEE